MLTTFDNSSAISVRGVSKHFRLQESQSLQEFASFFLRGRGWLPPFQALKDVSFDVASGETFGIIGRNGSGKSTLLKLIAGIMEPSKGEILVSGRLCPIIELGVGFHPDLSGLENVFLKSALLGLSNKETKERLGDIIEFAELESFMNTPVKHYSTGMQVRLSFALSVFCDPDILLVDEALAVGDVKFQERCLEKMDEIQGRGVTILFVSHTIGKVEEFCGRAVLLEHGEVMGIGSASDMVARYNELVQASPITT